MPEGDTIFRTARALHRALAGQTVTKFETALAPLARVDDDAAIAGRTIEKVEAKGKWCLIHLSGDLILLTHMLMSGSWHLYQPGERWRMRRAHMRVVIETASWQAIAFNVPVAEFHTARSLARHTSLPQLGPDILSDRYTPEGGAARLRAYAAEHPATEVGVALLNQRVLAGLGNVYKSEVAFAAGVNPFRALSTVTSKEFDVMADMAQRWMQANVADGAGDGSGSGIVTYFGPRRTTGNSNRDDRLWVYRREGQECRRCGGIIAMRKQGEQARSTYWCPQCQPWVAAPGQSVEPPMGRTIATARRRRSQGSC